MIVKKPLLALFILLQLIIIVYLSYQIYKKGKNINNINVSILKKEAFTFNSLSSLKYFYEPKPSLIEKGDEWFPFPLIPSIDLKEVSYTINSDTLNSTREFSIDKPADTFRVITLGDSFTFGLYVNTKDSWPQVLENLLNTLKCKKNKKFEVINLGVPGYDIQYSVERYRLRGAKYKPDLVLWFLKTDDFQQIVEEFSPELYNTTINFDKKIEMSSNSNKVAAQLINKINNIFTNSTYKKLGKKNTMILQEKALKKINDYYSSPLLIFTFPNTNDQFVSIMKKFSSQRNRTIFYGGLTQIYNDPNLHLADGHPSKEGHKTIANDLFNNLVKNKTSICN